ncbi:MAG: hypothetical protein JXR77_11920, partial [Lentisphaeria bacterium]|nr:hypothetical protein [Lentisphaeria bacterium]
MEPGRVHCPVCAWQVSPADLGQESVRCSRCLTRLDVTVFPALFRDLVRGRLGERIIEDSQAGCFFHPGRKASVACDGCGRFLCELCDLPMGDRHLCPQCLKEPARAAETRVREVTLGTTTTLYDNIALSLAILPLIVFYMTVITAPITLFFVVHYWNRVRTPIP